MLDKTPTIDLTQDLTEAQAEAARQIEICNACRYCEGYCAVFPAMFKERAFDGGDITQLANLCHNCRGCYYACQYTAPHEFDLNLPQALANVRQDSWEDLAFPRAAGRAFAADLAGAGTGTLATSAVLLPLTGLYGVAGALMAVKVLSLLRLLTAR